MSYLLPVTKELLADLGSFALVLDARTPREYAEDHIPGSVNMPVVDEDVFAEVGTLHRSDQHAAYAHGVAAALRNIAAALPDLAARFPARTPFLIYCFRGGKRSKLWADALETVGYKTHLVQGGWKAYRRYVTAALAELPKQFRYIVLTGATGCGKTRLLAALAEQGAQVLDLEAVARHRGSLIGSVPGERQPPQKLFDSMLLAKMRQFDPARPIWIEAESKKIGSRQLPDALFESMSANALTTIEVTASMPSRVRLWNEDYAHHAADPLAMVEKLWPIRPLVGGEEYALWVDLATARQTDQLFERVMANHYDPAYLRSTSARYEHAPKAQEQIHLDDLQPAALAPVALDLIRGHEGRV